MAVSTKSHEELRKEFLFREFWGFEKVPGPENFEVYAKALLVICNADGELADEERNYVLGLIAGMGGEPSLIEQLRTYQATDEIHDLLTQDSKTHASSRALIYDAIRACSADGMLHPREIAKIYDVAGHLAIPPKVVEELQSIYQDLRHVIGRLFLTTYPGAKNRPY